MRIVFMGTPEIAKNSLRKLLDFCSDNGHEIVGVYTKMDKPVGRKQVLTPSVVKEFALSKGLKVHQPKTLREQTATSELQMLEPDLVVVVAYGLILPKEVLNAPKFGCINLHVSLLPKYRGAAPIQWAVINGEKKTGVSIMQMDEGLDTGPLIAQEEIKIGENATAGEVFEQVSSIGASLLCKTILDVFESRITQKPQEGEATFAPQLSKKIAEIDFGRDAKELHNLVRGSNPWPMAWFVHEGKRVKILKAKHVQEKGEIGEVLKTKPLTIACGNGALVVETVHPEGAKQMDGWQWAMGRRLEVGQVVAKPPCYNRKENYVL